MWLLEQQALLMFSKVAFLGVVATFCIAATPVGSGAETSGRELAVRAEEIRLVRNGNTVLILAGAVQFVSRSYSISGNNASVIFENGHENQVMVVGTPAMFDTKRAGDQTHGEASIILFEIGTEVIHLIGSPVVKDVRDTYRGAYHGCVEYDVTTNVVSRCPDCSRFFIYP